MNNRRHNAVFVNADDYGLSKETTDAIAQSFELGYLDATSMIVNMVDFERACCVAKDKGFLDKVGLHLNLSEGLPLTDSIKKDRLFCNPQTGLFSRTFQNSLLYRIWLPRKSRLNVRNEIIAQIDKYHDGGMNSNSLDSHHHIHKEPSVLFVLLPLLKERGFSRIRIAKNTGHGFRRFLNCLINLIFAVYPGVSKRAEYLVESISEYINLKPQGSVEIEVHPYLMNNKLIDKTNEEWNICQMDSLRLIRQSIEE